MELLLSDMGIILSLLIPDMLWDFADLYDSYWSFK